MSEIKKSEDLTSFGKTGLIIRTYASPKWDRIRCPGYYVSSVGMSRPLQMFYGNFFEFNEKVKLCNKVKFRDKITSKCNV